ncbi:hypothetical protein NUU61_004697 [Penicillium alfredii]|uniref:Uncharacterized protein n=1 Tax=Penicillium alfredii TaxID=1506179 RepID=A0A9W9K7H4_9EURO|nr:uncharacterized protein NUU61_004697 [Penicillium alfredii]KAJ5095341.1 hypothetical protein NUU61_004697 [Penicillium alfredii]
MHNLYPVDAHDQFAKDIADEPLETDKAEYRYAGTTDFPGTKVFPILNDYLQPDAQTWLEFSIKSILEIVPDAPLSTEICTIGEIVLVLAQQIPYHIIIHHR